MREATPPVPAGDTIDSPRLVLRDGTVASVRPSSSADRDAIRRFFHELSPESRRNRFFTSSEPPESLVDRMADSSDPRQALTLLVHRFRTDDVRPVAVASYMAVNATNAEVAFAVADTFQGRGVATVLLERLAVHATRHGFRKFQASTFADNHAMLEVFRDSGFEIRSKTTAGVVDLQLSLTMSAEGVRSSEERERAATAASLAPLLKPASVAVVGVSRDDRTSIGRRVFDALRAGGFTGPIHPVNPHADAIDGVPCHGSARALPRGIDLAVIAVPAPLVLAAVDEVIAGATRRAFVVTRPPGHHARAGAAMGFCFFNAVAVAARDAQRRHGLGRVLVADFDVHHGNGTQETFWDDGTVAYLSVHRFPFYPGTGSRDETGSGAGLGTTANFPLPAGSGDDAFAGGLEAALDGLARRFRPDFVLVSAGFDAHHRDPLGGMRVSAEGYARLSRTLADLADAVCGGRLVSVLEGGYDPEGTAEGALAHARALVESVEPSN